MSSRWLRNSFIYLLILVAVVAIVFSFFRNGDSAKTIAFSEVVANGRDGKLESIEVNGQNLRHPSSRPNPITKYNSRIGDERRRRAGAHGQRRGHRWHRNRSPSRLKYKEPSQYGNLDRAADQFRPDPGLRRDPDLHDAPGAGLEQPGDVLRQEQGADVHRRQADRDLRRRGRRGRGQAGARRKSSSSSRSRRSSPRWARASPRACCWSGRPAPARR